MILVTGATGHMGKRVGELLAAQGVPLRLLVRPGAASPEIEAEIAHGDYGDAASMRAACAGVETAFLVSVSAPPGERARLHARAFAAAAEAGVKHLVYLSLQGAGPHSVYPYSRDHFESESALATCGVAHTIVRNGKYTEQLLEPEMAGGDGVLRGPITDGRVAWISRADSARVVAALLVAPPGGVVTPTGPEALTLEETARRLTQALGRPFRCQHESDLVLRTRLLAQGMAPWRVDLWVGAYEAMALGEYAEVGDTSKWMGLAERLEDTVASGALDALRTRDAPAETRS